MLSGRGISAIEHQKDKKGRRRKENKMKKKYKVGLFSSLMALLLVSATVIPTRAESALNSHSESKKDATKEVTSEDDKSEENKTTSNAESTDETEETPSSDIIIQSDDEDKVNKLASDAEDISKMTDDTYVVTYDSPEKAQEVQTQVIEPDESVEVVENLMFSVEDDESNDDWDPEPPYSESQETTESENQSDQNNEQIDSNQENNDQENTPSNADTSEENAEEAKPDESNTRLNVTYTDGQYWVDETPYRSLRDLADATGKKLVAVIDTGAGKEQNVINVNLTEEESEYDTNGHGSVIVQSIEDNDNNGSIILSIKALGQNGTGYMSDVMKAVQYAIDEQVDYLNMSIAAPKSKNTSAFEQLVTDAVNSNITVVAAAGNYNSDVAKYVPASIEGVYSVGAAQQDLSKVRKSNFNAKYWEVADSTSVAAGIVTGKLVAGQEIMVSLPDGSDTKASEKVEFDPIFVATEENIIKNPEENIIYDVMDYDINVNPVVYNDMVSTGGKGFISVPLDLSEYLSDLQGFKDENTGYYHYVFDDDETGFATLKKIQEDFKGLPVYISDLKTLFTVQDSKYAFTTNLNINSYSTNGIPWAWNSGTSGTHQMRFVLKVTTDGNGSNSYEVRDAFYYPSDPYEGAQGLELIDLPTTVEIVGGRKLYSGNATYDSPIINNMDHIWSKGYKVCSGTFTQYGTFTVKYTVDTQAWINKNSVNNSAFTYWDGNGGYRYYWVTSDSGSRYLSSQVTINAGGVFSFNLNIYDPNGTERYQDGGAGSVEMQVNGGSWTRVYNEPASSYAYGTKFKFRNFTPGTGMEANGTSGLNSSWEATMTENGLTINFYTKWKTFTLDLNGYKDGTTAYDIAGYAKADIYINGSKVGSDVEDFFKTYSYGTKYKVVIKPTTGHSSTQTTYEGTMTGDVGIWPKLTTNKYTLDLNGWLDGKDSGNISGYGTADVYVDGNMIAQGVTDFCQDIKYGSSYEIKNIKAVTGKQYVGVHSGSIKGTMGTSRINVSLEFKTKTYTLTINPNGGSYGGSTSMTGTYLQNMEIKDIPTRMGYKFTGWSRSSTGKIHGGNAYAYDSHFTMTEKGDSDGTPYTNYSMNYTNTSGGYNWPWINFLHYQYTANHTYRLEFDVRVNSVSGLECANVRSSAFDNNWEAPAVSINSKTNGWVHRSLSRAYSGTTVTQAGTATTINPLIEFYCTIPNGGTGSINFDIKNISIFDETAGKYVSSTTDNVKNGSTYTFGDSNGTIYAQWSKVEDHYVIYDTNGGQKGTTVNNPNKYVTIDDGIYAIQSGLSGGRYIHVSGGSTEKNAGLVLYDGYSISSLQTMWQLERVGDTPYYYIINRMTGLVLNLPGDGDKVTDQTQLWTQLDGTQDYTMDFLWYFKDAGNGYVYICNKKTNKCLDVTSGTDANDTAINLYQSNSSAAQKWKLKLVTQEDGAGNYQRRKVSYGANMLVNTVTPTRLGYTFAGWNTKKDGSGTKFVGGQEIKYPSADVTLYAQWTPITYTNVIYHRLYGLTNGEGNNESKTGYLMEKTTFKGTYTTSYPMGTDKGVGEINGVELLKFGYWENPTKSENWVTKDIGSTIAQLPKATSYVYQYIPVNYAITYNMNDTSGSPESRAVNDPDNPSTYTVFYGVHLKEPTRKGYIFTGWVDQNGNKIEGINENIDMSFLAADGSSTTKDVKAELAKRRSGNITLTATWQATAPSITAKNNYYMQNEEVTSEILKSNATAKDDLETEESITSKITITKITYEDGTVVENPTNLDTSTPQTVQITYGTTNDRGGHTEISKTVKIVPIKGDDYLEDPDSNSDTGESANIFARYIDKNYKYTLPENSQWKTSSEYQNELDSMDKSGDQYLKQYDNLLNGSN